MEDESVGEETGKTFQNSI